MVEAEAPTVHKLIQEEPTKKKKQNKTDKNEMKIY